MAPTRPIRVLVVEDVDVMLSLMESMLQAIPGISVSGLARNTQEARLELTRRRPDLVLLDEILPGESSLDLLTELQELEIPVILVTGMETADHPIPPGAHARLAKPDWDTLEQAQKRFRTAIAAVFKNT